MSFEEDLRRQLHDREDKKVAAQAIIDSVLPKVDQWRREWEEQAASFARVANEARMPQHDIKVSKPQKSGWFTTSRRPPRTFRVLASRADVVVLANGSLREASLLKEGIDVPAFSQSREPGLSQVLVDRDVPLRRPPEYEDVVWLWRGSGTTRTGDLVLTQRWRDGESYSTFEYFLKQELTRHLGLSG